MAGKRPDQHNIDPREAGATDYKSLPQQGHSRGALDDTVELDRQRVAQSETDVESQGNAPFYDRSRPAPSRFANAGRPVDEQAEPERGNREESDRSEEMRADERGAEEMSGRERESEGTEDPRERGVGG